MLSKIIIACLLASTNARDDPKSSRDKGSRKDRKYYTDSSESSDSSESRYTGYDTDIFQSSDSFDPSDSFDMGEPFIDLVPVDETDEKTKSITIKNACSFDIDLGFTGGYSGLSVDEKCKENQENDGTGKCFWSLNVHNYLESGETTYLKLEEQENSDVIWSGNVFALKHPFMKDACPDGQCKPFQGPTGAVTLAEFTMTKEGLVYFDISLIHGVTIPTSMGPTGGLKSTESDPYRDGTAGDCTWEFTAPVEHRKYLIEVKNSHDECSLDNECDQGEVCGSFFGNETPVYGTCGEFFAYVNAHTNCIAGSMGYPFFCESYSDLYGCSGMYTDSGYSHIENGPGVCGCSDYEDLDIVSNYPCMNKNPIWEEKAYKWIHYIKEGCTSGYEYPYSDSTSTFTSFLDNYEITFCPGDSEKKFFI